MVRIHYNWPTVYMKKKKEDNEKTQEERKTRKFLVGKAT